MALVAVGGLLLYDSVRLAQHFEGSPWALPSLVYAAPVRLAPGTPVDLGALVRHLERMGYRRGAADLPGTYRTDGATWLEVYVRSWRDAAGPHPAHWLRIRFRAGRVARIEGAPRRVLAEAVLEPERLAALWGPRREEREVVPLERIPRGLVAAVLAAEDARFYRHHGIDVLAALRALWVNLRRGEILQGGSTITQQTVKNLFLSHERTWARKLRELPLALLLDARYSKERILEVYLNEVYLGQRGSVAICGVAAAARHYFGRPLHELSLGEWALLAGLIRSPGTYNPFLHAERAVVRRNQVLDAMERLGWIGPEEARRAREELLRLASPGGRELAAPYAVDAVVAALRRRLPGIRLEREGLRIETTLDPLAQEAAQEALRRALRRLERERPSLARRGAALEGAVLVTRPGTGEILALVGGRDYARSQFNRALQARRQPGSCFKPFVYLAAFEAAVRGEPGGLVPASLLQDTPLVVRAGGRPWSPENEDGTYRGSLSARESLEFSRNVPTVRAALGVGIERVAQLAASCGIASPLKAVPSLALGAVEVRPVELAEAFGTLANGGIHVPLHLLRAVTDSEGRVRWRAQAEPRRVVSAEAAFLVNDVLRGVLERGTARRARALGFTGEAAGKTGTTDGMRDAWFVGYQSDWLALVWVGFDDHARAGLTGASGALPVWVDLARRLGRDAVPAGFAPPPGLVARRVDPGTGALATRACPAARREWFPRNAIPEHRCPEHRGSWWRRWWWGGREAD